MTELAQPLVVRVVTAHCDGQCGGDVTLVTDIHTVAFAETDTYGDTPFKGQAAANVVRHADKIEVGCGSWNDRDDVTCDGVLVVTDAEIGSFPWSDAKTTFANGHLTPMERAQ